MEPKMTFPLGPISPDLESELVALMREGRTIEAIKRLRAATGASLAESKGWVDERLQHITMSPPRWTGPPCPYCGKDLPTDQARQCFECGMDWHDPSCVVDRGRRRREQQ
jgi:hypothetical protein